MGEVYAARDTRLGRKVALKILRAVVDVDDSTRRRFGVEAQTASALNHPNIVTVFDIGQADGVDFIAMEFVEGQSLREIMSKGRIDIGRAVDWMAQAAAGLAAAHDAAIVHRDIKPENLTITATGHLKILDFGLAKLFEKQQTVLAAEQVTVSLTPAMTQVGAIVGTTSYMSPEQARAETLDGQTDIFSLGTVLYELLTGEKGFKGATVIDVLHAVLNTDPKPATELNPRLPSEMLEILDKALAKDRSRRYRHAGDFELDLRRFRHALESGTLASQRSSRDAGGTRRWSRILWVTAGTLLGATIVAGAWLADRNTRSETATTGLDDVVVSPFTTDEGFESDPAFSADGERIAYVSDRTGNLEIFVRQVSGGADINISQDAADDVQPSFSPDGTQLVFVSTRSGASGLVFMGPNTPPKGGDIWVIPALGGNARRIAVGGNFPSWSPDGTEVLFTSGPWFAPRLYRVSAAGGEPREITLQFSPGVSPGHLLYPRYSADGEWIAFSSPTDVYVVKAAGGGVTAIALGQAPIWGAGSRSIVYSSGNVGTNQSLWSIGFDPARGVASGAPRPLTVGRGADLHPTASKDGRRIAFAATDVSTHIETQLFDAETGHPRGSPAPLTTSRDQIYFFDLTPDGRGALFEVNRGPASTIWRARADGTMVQLISNTQYDHSNPLWSPDGTSIAFSRRSTRDLQAPFSLWKMASDGANPQPLVERLGVNGLFTWMPDGRGIIHTGPGRQLYLLDLATRTERKLTDEAGIMPVVAVSPDGKWVVYQCVAGATIDLHAIPVEGGPARILTANIQQDYHPSVSASGRWVYYLPDHKNLYRIPGPAQDWRKAPPEKVIDFQLTPASFVENPQLSRDGTRLAYSRGRITSDIWLMTISR
jgi:Tol biopolymer transport system component/serine/threonine protein kinase